MKHVDQQRDYNIDCYSNVEMTLDYHSATEIVPKIEFMILADKIITTVFMSFKLAQIYFFCQSVNYSVMLWIAQPGWICLVTCMQLMEPSD